MRLSAAPSVDRCRLSGYAEAPQERREGFECSLVPSHQTRPCRGHAAKVPAMDRRDVQFLNSPLAAFPRSASVLLPTVSNDRVAAATRKRASCSLIRGSVACQEFLAFLRC